MRRSPWARVVLICRLVARDLRHRPGQAVLLLVAISAATATLTLGLVLNGVTSQPYLRTKAATNGPDVVAAVLPQSTAPPPASALAQLAALDGAPGVAASSGPYPVASAALRAHGHTVPVQAEGRGETAAVVDQPALTQGSWVRPGGVVLERTFAEALGVRVGTSVTLNGRSFRVVGIAVTTATPEYPQVCYYLTCNSYGQASESAMGLVWVSRSAAAGLATRAMPLSYLLNLRLDDPASATAFVSAHGSANPSAPQLLSWQQVSYADNDLVSVAQQVLTPGAWLAVALAVASVAVLAGGRMTEQTRRVGQLKAVGAAPAMVAAVLLAEHMILALVAAAAGLTIGWLVAPLLSDAGAGLVGSPGAPALTLGAAGLVIGVALGVTLAATLVPAFRAARTSTVSALADSPRPPRRLAVLIAISAWLPVPMLIGLRLIARRPRRAFLSAAGTAVTVTGIVAVLAAHHANDVTDRRFDWFAGLADPVAGRVSRVMAVLTVIVVCLAAVNAIAAGWATALDARQPSALSRALGGTARQVSVGLSMAQVLPTLPGALIGVPLGIELFHVANGGGIMSVPPAPWLAAVILGTLAAVALLTAVPARLGARGPVAGILKAELA